MANAMDNKSSLEIRNSFLYNGTIPEEAQSFEALSQCLIIDRDLRKNLSFVQACVQIDPSLIKFAAKKVKEILHPVQVIFATAPHLKNPSPSVEKKAKESRMVQEFKTKHHFQEKSS
jgi:hypothetical protein